MVKCFFFACLISFGVFAKPVKVTAIYLPPYILASEDHDKQGFIPEFIRASFKLVGREVKFTFLPPKRAAIAFAKNGGLAVSTFGILGHENLHMIKLAIVKGGLFSTQQSEKEVKKVVYLRGIRRAKEAILGKGMEGVPVADYKAGLKMIEAGRANGILAINPCLDHAIEKNFPGLENKMKMLGPPTHIDAGGVVGDKTQVELLKELQKGMALAKEKGIFDELARKYLGKYLQEAELTDFVSDDFKIISNSD